MRGTSFVRRGRFGIKSVKVEHAETHRDTVGWGDARWASALALELHCRAIQVRGYQIVVYSR